MATMTELYVTNFKKIRTARVACSGQPLVQVTGINAQGKTSLLDAIDMLFRGKKYSEATRPVRDGADKSTIEGTTDTGYVIKRTIATTGGTSLTVTAPDGTNLTSPQTVLDRWLASLAFDPLAFSKMKPAEQVAELKRAVGLDFTELDNARDEAFARRRNVNRDVEQLKTRMATTPHHPNTPTEEVSIADLNQQFTAAVKKNSDADVAWEAAERASKDIDHVATQINAVEQRLQELISERDRAHTKAIKLMEKANVLAKAKVDTDAIELQVATAEQTNTRVRSNQQRAALAAEHDQKAAKAAELTRAIEHAEQEKRNRLGQAKFPIDDLTFDDAGVIYRDQPFGQASGAERVRVGTAIALAMRTELRVLLIRDGSSLDVNNLAMIGEMAEAAGGQVFIERVERGGAGIEIVDGEVAGAK